MANAALQLMVPTREFGDPLDGPAAPGLRRFSIEPLANPLLALGLTDMVWARGFLHKIEMDLQERHRIRMSQPQTMTAGGLAYAPMSRVEEDLRELQRRAKASREQTALAANQAKPTPAAGGALLDDAAEKLAEELWAASAGNLEMATGVLDRFWAKFAQEKFQTPDLMSLLLVSHEELLWENESLSPTAGGAAPGAGRMRMASPSIHLAVQPSEGGEMGGAGVQSPFATPLQVVATAPAAPGSAVVMPLQPRRVGEKTDVEIAMASGKAARSTASREEVEVRLISIREMLWHYFQAYPKDYPAALAAVLGLSIAQVSDPGTLDERIAFEVARAGSWSLALRVWQEIVKHQKMRSARAAGSEAAQAVAQGMVPPQPRAGRRWWSLSANWEGLNFGNALRALAKMIFAS